ncbi:hypothetical protein [Proteus sp. FME41]|uniref:hypothetical protein n=1 Tax=Proteus sp. FME41 TaxID=2742608 RepID=UPI001867D782|nr:hypothetical protein [Proteus sp. FME41]
MPLPNRLKPIKISKVKLNELIDLLLKITNKIDNGATENDPELNTMMINWNAQVVTPCVFSDFRDYNSWTSAKEFTKIAFNQVKYLDDLTYEELISIIDFICLAEGSESEQSYAMKLLKINFKSFSSDLIYWPDEYFNLEEVDDLTSEEIAAYLMEGSNRKLFNTPKLQLKYSIPKGINN